MGSPPSLQTAAVGTEDESEMSDWDRLVDRFNTRGGLIVASLLGTGSIFLLNKVLEAITGDTIQAGIWTTGVTFTALLGWTFTYFTRVATKSTTYAQQLADYEQKVMLRRLEELTDEEIAALCLEVGISEVELQEVMSDTVGDKGSASKLSNKEKVLAIFKSTPTAAPQDPRMMF